MNIFIALTYYRPHYSGLTIYTERLARALVERGHAVTVLTSRFNRTLAPRDTCHGVEVVRLPVMMRVSKGVIMPSILLQAVYLARRADVVNLHVPQLDAAPIALISRMLGKPVALTYHCDLHLPKGFIHSVANRVSHTANWVSAQAANVIVTNTRDYAENSPFLKHFLPKVTVIPPPVIMPEVTDRDIEAFKKKYGITAEQQIIGMAARLATEKGVEYLIQSLPAILAKHPQARVLFVGQYQNVLGEDEYAARLTPLLQKLGGSWSFLGVISPVELAVFYRICDVVVLPSINGTESYGMVQVEAMTCGTPVVATDLPGVRQPVLNTGMGKIVPVRNAPKLAAAINEVLEHPEVHSGEPERVASLFSPESIARQYEDVFEEIIFHGSRSGR